MANMNSDSRHLGTSEVDHERDPGPMNIQFEPSDLRSKRPFCIEPTNIVNVNHVIQRVSDHASAMNKRIHYYSRLTTPADKALIAPDHVVPAPEECYVYSPLGSAYKLQSYTEGYGKNTSLVTIFMIWNTMMGTSILSIPWGIKQAGFTTGMCVIILMGLLTLYCCYRVVKSRTMMYFIHHINDTDTILSTNNSNPGTVSVLYLIFLVTFKAVRLGFHLEFHWFIPTEFFVPEIRFQFPQLTGVLTLAFFIHNCIITLLKNNKKQENNVRDLCIAYMLVTLTYLYIGVLVFASFPSPPLSKDCIEQNFLDNFPSSDTLSFIARIFLLFQMMTVYPLLGYLARVQLLGHIFGDIYPSIFHVLILNLIIVGAGVIMACFYPNIGGIIRYSGAACGLAFVFIYPSLIYIISLHQEERLTWPKLIFHVFIIILGVANLIVQFFM
ncbi:neutral amino acid transporter 9 isoform X10 [Homo sapiens]|uniref:neutral amino acid transporter 9 isoform X10 n=1 Tax=Homo sapiens TaxID=9606 RepID=UPI0005D0351A|nr:neutral amino acid transporter 9 isoform X10 [Homo sapiens]XP_047272752.1 neutral amino acid transporter 9 isoform X10 [Homo sapiens]XP_047272753.1 neutral amino acid transporter 9 isoform X10 [Homo sapiens]XP_054207731.1 neutral amino acid transporter 9 isoform X10 [Homo sapiens]XP_054207732.1 neutral amino acid transporter 9 isoform X10 [Homo sapiens]XP_054207733.1 neutral amino acid transporter 9 isoform X10 [Homo sapiens]|eukprot:XP_011541485.1 sodium-coupled neutral amino acid transporter 9 isoform X9 [Homo sapiens]